MITPEWHIDIAGSDDLTAWKPYCTTTQLFNLNAPDRLPNFSGLIRYTATIDLADGEQFNAIDLGQVGQNARLLVNGTDCGIRICPPYRFALNGLLKPGQNTIEIVAANTLAQKHRDGFSYFLALEPAGMLGDVRLLS